MSHHQLKKLAIKYHVEDVPDSLLPGTSLSNVIKRIEFAPEYIPEITKEYLKTNGFQSLLSYASKQISFDEFSEISLSEQKERKLETEKAIKKKAKQAAIDAKKDRRRRQANNLFRRYSLSVSAIKDHDIKKLHNIVEKADKGSRLNQDEIAWLIITRKRNGSGYYTKKLREKYHENEAGYFLSKFRISNNPWDVINASSQLRKCDQSRKANSILTKVNNNILNSKKIKSAFRTTLGGVKRDLNIFPEALSLGEKAHVLTPKDFRPCTLLGAVNIEIGNYEEGKSWYQKAIDRGATEKSVDDDLRSIFKRTQKSNRKKLAIFLYKNDPSRYNWVKKYIK